jgi:hypothetical protein
MEFNGMLGVFLCVLGMACIWVLERRFQFDDKSIWKGEKEGAIIYYNTFAEWNCIDTA